ncbi:MAG: hypothetical protein KME45_07910 [Stenomitos rutilans HA7619-LM2]|nr:hypothetical protein [Stenomitos rutilans HA7619-LM2]
MEVVATWHGGDPGSRAKIPIIVEGFFHLDGSLFSNPKVCDVHVLVDVTWAIALQATGIASFVASV